MTGFMMPRKGLYHPKFKI